MNIPFKTIDNWKYLEEKLGICRWEWHLGEAGHPVSSSGGSFGISYGGGGFVSHSSEHHSSHHSSEHHSSHHSSEHHIDLTPHFESVIKHRESFLGMDINEAKKKDILHQWNFIYNSKGKVVAVVDPNSAEVVAGTGIHSLEEAKTYTSGSYSTMKSAFKELHPTLEKVGEKIAHKNIFNLITQSLSNQPKTQKSNKMFVPPMFSPNQPTDYPLFNSIIPNNSDNLYIFQLKTIHNGGRIPNKKFQNEQIQLLYHSKTKFPICIIGDPHPNYPMLDTLEKTYPPQFKYPAPMKTNYAIGGYFKDTIIATSNKPRLTIYADDGFEVYLNKKLIYSYWKGEAITKYEIPLPLKQNETGQLEIYWFDNCTTGGLCCIPNGFTLYNPKPVNSKTTTTQSNNHLILIGIIILIIILFMVK